MGLQSFAVAFGTLNQQWPNAGQHTHFSDYAPLCRLFVNYVGGVIGFIVRSPNSNPHPHPPLPVSLS